MTLSGSDILTIRMNRKRKRIGGECPERGSSEGLKMALKGLPLALVVVIGTHPALASSSIDVITDRALEVDLL